MKNRRFSVRTFLVLCLATVSMAGTDVALAQDELSPQGSVFAMLPDSPISLQLHEADLKSVLRSLGKEFKLNLLVHEDVSGVITLGLENIAFRDAFQAIARTRGTPGR